MGADLNVNIGLGQVVVNAPTVPTDPIVVQERLGSAAEVRDALAATARSDITKLTSKLTVIRLMFIRMSPDISVLHLSVGKTGREKCRTEKCRFIGVLFCS
jgi:hypothetical protein